MKPACRPPRACGEAPLRGCPVARVQGFTLIEVLVALVIVALGMLGVIQAVSQTASNSSYLRDKTIAHWLAMNQLTITRLAGQPPKIDKSSDEIEMAGRRWRWSMEVTQTPVESIRRIDIQVRPEDADEKSSLASVTGFYGEAIAQPGTTIVMWQGTDEPPAGDEDGAGQKEDDSDDGRRSPTPTPDPGGEPTDPPLEPDPEAVQ